MKDYKCEVCGHWTACANCSSCSHCSEAELQRLRRVEEAAKELIEKLDGGDVTWFLRDLKAALEDK